MVILPSELEYDLQYGVDRDMFEDYIDSPYDDPNEGEYMCMVNYLNAMRYKLHGHRHPSETNSETL